MVFGLDPDDVGDADVAAGGASAGGAAFRRDGVLAGGGAGGAGWVEQASQMAERTPGWTVVPSVATPHRQQIMALLLYNSPHRNNSGESTQYLIGKFFLRA